jgi:hypothetical protein
MKTRRWRKGVILLQTLVMSVVLSMIAVMVLKWVLGRYMLTARSYRSAVTTTHATSFAQTSFATWNLNTSAVPSNGCSVLDAKTICYTTSGSGDTMRKFSIVSDEDQ